MDFSFSRQTLCSSTSKQIIKDIKFSCGKRRNEKDNAYGEGVEGGRNDSFIIESFYLAHQNL